MDTIFDFFNEISSFDTIYLTITLWTLFECSKKGFLLSLLSASKWLLAYVITLFLFPKAKPYVDGLIDSEYVLDVVLGISLFVIVIFIILLINRSIKKAITYTGLGTMDRIFGFFFGFFKAYIICVCIFATINIIYNHKKWPINLDQSVTFPWVEKGSNYLIKEFPSQKEYEKAKEKVQDL
tara:strand:- start:195 stop:737 length:543 start_codon:yes stop_codon:yes gene_type:complete